MATYWLETGGPAAGNRGDELLDAVIVLVGCRGTGGYLAEAVCRLLIGHRAELYLVDMDRVEAHNVARQAFNPTDVGRFKAEVLAERLARRFRRTVHYSVLPYQRELHAQVFRNRPSRFNLIIGAVDNAQARRDIATTLDGYTPASAGSPLPLWLDCGNGRNAGQVLLGNAMRAEMLDSPPQPQPQPDCTKAVAHQEQSGTVNHVVAAIAAAFVEKLLANACTWLAAYFDMDDGTRRSVHADPRIVARIAGLHLNAVAPPVLRHELLRD